METTAVDRGRWSALIVEDDPGQSELGALMLREFDLVVAQVASAEAAIEHLCRESGAVTVLLADIKLPGPMDGLALAHRVAVLWPSISVIVTSGAPTLGERSLPARATFVPKPWRPLDIVTAAERASRADHSVHSLRL